MDLFFLIQVLHFGLVVDFVVRIFGVLGLDMRVCWGFWAFELGIPFT
jgi:hypothetical protein